MQLLALSVWGLYLFYWGNKMTIPIPSLTAASSARSGARNSAENTFITGDLIAGSSSKNNNYMLYALIGLGLFLTLRKK